MNNSPELECIMDAMLKRREEIKLVLGDGYPKRVAGYINIVRKRMAARDINAISAGLELLDNADGQIDAVTSALVVSAAIDIIAADVPGRAAHLSSMFYKGGLAPAVLIDGREQREGVDHE